MADTVNGLKWSKKEAESLPQSEVECPSQKFLFDYDLKTVPFGLLVHSYVI